MCITPFTVPVQNWFYLTGPSSSRGNLEWPCYSVSMETEEISLNIRLFSLYSADDSEL